MTEAEKIQMEIKQKEAEVLGLKKKLEQQKKEDEQYTRWKPNNGEKYWYISYECAFASIWSNNYHDQNLYNYCNIFKTREDAIEILKAVKNVLKAYQLGILISPNKDFDVETRLLFDNPDEQIKAIKIFKEEF